MLKSDSISIICFVSGAFVSMQNAFFCFTNIILKDKVKSFGPELSSKKQTDRTHSCGENEKIHFWNLLDYLSCVLNILVFVTHLAASHHHLNSLYGIYTISQKQQLNVIVACFPTRSLHKFCFLEDTRLDAFFGCLFRHKIQRTVFGRTKPNNRL